MKKAIPCLILMAALAACGKKKQFHCDSQQVDAPAGDSAFIFVPTAFSPNGDGLNDAFPVWTYRVKSIQWEIYDQEGTVLYTTSDLNGRWDPGGAPAQGMTLYHYKLQAVTNAGNTIVRCGYLYRYTCIPAGFSMEHIVFPDQFDPSMPQGYLKGTSSEVFTQCP